LGIQCQCRHGGYCELVLVCHCTHSRYELIASKRADLLSACTRPDRCFTREPVDDFRDARTTRRCCDVQFVPIDGGAMPRL